MARQIRTKFFILSDTHGEELPLPNEEFDVAIHSGDLTEESKLVEFQRSLEILGKIKAPLKLVIAGNHDFTLDPPMFQKKLAEAQLRPDDPTVRREYGSLGEARELFTTASREGGVRYLDEGTHEFTLPNGAKLTVYASPHTPSVNDWGFQYHPDEKHDWQVGEADVVITHGPPRGIFDTIGRGKRAGDQALFAAVAKSRPKLHCFGHMHQCWGAKLVSWKGEEASNNPTHFTDIDGEQTRLIESLATIEPKKSDDEDTEREKQRRSSAMEERRYALAEVDGVKSGETLFVNSAIESSEEGKQHLPWVVEIGLPRADVAAIENVSTEIKQQTTLDKNAVTTGTQDPCGESTATESPPGASYRKRRFNGVQEEVQAKRAKIEVGE